MKDEDFFNEDLKDAANGDNSEGDSVNVTPSESSNFDDTLRLCQTTPIADITQAVKAILPEPETFCKFLNATLNSTEDE